MSTRDDLLALVEASPRNPILVSLLRDHLVLDLDMLESEADAHVAVVVETAHTANQIRQATALLAERYHRRGHVLRCIYQHCGIPAGEYPTVVVVAGDGIQVGTAGDTADADPYWGRTVIAVGARWLLTHWDQYVQALPGWRPHRRTRRRSR